MSASRIDFAAVNSVALRHLPDLVARMLPGGKRAGSEWIARNPKRGDNSAGSFSINLLTGKWADFATGDAGGDIISLEAYLHDTTQVDAAKVIAAQVGFGAPIGTIGTIGTQHRMKTRPIWRPIVPAPEGAPDLSSKLVAGCAPGFEWTGSAHYFDQSGLFLGTVARYDRIVDGRVQEKTFRSFVFCESDDGRQEWRCQGFPEPRPLYGLPDLAARAAAPVLIVEGEKAADTAKTMFPDHVVMTSPNGAQSPHKADWSPIKGRHVVIWPDHDEPGARYAAVASEMIAAAGATSVRIVTLPGGLPLGWDLADPLPASLGRADLDMALSSATASSASTSTAQSLADTDPWLYPDLSLLGTGRRPAPDFPLDVLGDYWSAWVTRRAAGASAPVDYVATALLACVGAMIANVRWPVAGANWSEPPVLWCGIVGSPSSSKSPAMDAAFELVQHAEDRMAIGFDQEQRDHETKRQVSKARREAWDAEVKATVKAGGSPPNLPDDAVMPDDLVRPRVRVADFTMEKLGALAAALPRGLLVVRDELTGWLGSFDKYGGGGSDRAFAIEMYGGRSYIVDRVKNPEALKVRHLSVGILGGVQPDKLSTIIEGPEDGLAARLLWSWPEVLPEFSLARFHLDDGDARAAFAKLADLAMGRDEFGYMEPIRLPLSKEAEDVLEGFAREMSRRGNETTGIFSGALGKARGHALRLATVLEFLWWCGSRDAEPERISTRAVAAAAGLLDAYFVPMAERVHGDASIPVAERGAMLLARHLKRSGIVKFNARDARREIGGALRDAAAMEAACAVLIEAGLVRPQFNRSGATKGRPAKIYDVNDAVFRSQA